MLDYNEFAKKQVEWYKGQIEWYDKQIAWETRDLEQSRQEDRKLVEYIWSKGPLTKVDMLIWGSKKYESGETRKIKNQRARSYRQRKWCREQLAGYLKEVGA